MNRRSGTGRARQGVGVWRAGGVELEGWRWASSAVGPLPLKGPAYSYKSGCRIPIITGYILLFIQNRTTSRSPARPSAGRAGGEFHGESDRILFHHSYLPKKSAGQKAHGEHASRRRQMQVSALLLLGRSPYTDGASVTGPRLKKTLSARGVRVVFTYGKPSL